MSEEIGQLKLPAADGKNYATDVLSTKNVLRLVQSIPSPKAEPFKVWRAQVGADRLDEIADPEKTIMRGADFYRAKGYTEGWINQHLQTIEIRKELAPKLLQLLFQNRKSRKVLRKTKKWQSEAER